MSTLKPSSVVHPFSCTITFEGGGHKHTVTCTLESPTYYNQFFRSSVNSIIAEYSGFLHKILKPSAMGSPAAPSPPDQSQEKTT